MPKLTEEQIEIVSEALTLYSVEIAKFMKKAEKMNLKEQHTLKQTVLEIDAIRAHITNN